MAPHGISPYDSGSRVGRPEVGGPHDGKSEIMAKAKQAEVTGANVAGPKMTGTKVTSAKAANAKATGAKVGAVKVGTEDLGPLHVSKALAELIALRGFARPQADAQLQAAWDHAAGSDIATHTKVGELNRGALLVLVANAALLAELNGFHKTPILKSLQNTRPELRIKSLKFRLQSNLKKREIEHK